MLLRWAACAGWKYEAQVAESNLEPLDLSVHTHRHPDLPASLCQAVHAAAGIRQDAVADNLASILVVQFNHRLGGVEVLRDPDLGSRIYLGLCVIMSLNHPRDGQVGFACSLHSCAPKE